jgi:replication factor C subunit 2/4
MYIAITTCAHHLQKKLNHVFFLFDIFKFSSSSSSRLTSKVTLPPGRHKLIILDEADSMTASAQQALRRTMEIFSNTTRFALACNISSKIIEPIQSRCAILRYSRLSDQQILYRLTHVAEKEGVPCSEDGLEAIIFTAEGDMRNALNNLQATFAGFKHVNRENGNAKKKNEN